MIFEWETHEERLRRFMKISPLKKMEWLHEMHKFLVLASTEETRLIRRKLREMRNSNGDENN